MEASLFLFNIKLSKLQISKIVANLSFGLLQVTYDVSKLYNLRMSEFNQTVTP